ncbi:hypothetical protein BDV19DRAFT_357668 [Aspergillus venezuelensis]
MADEQFPWLDYPHLSQNSPRVVENSNAQWRSPFYKSPSSSNLQTSMNNNTTQSQYYPSYQQQDESYIRLEDVLPYTSYRWGSPPTREYSRQTAYTDNTSGKQSSTASIPNQSLERPAASDRQLPAPMPQYSTDSSLANDVYSGHDAKRRRLDPPVASQTSQASQVSQQPLSVLRVASPAYSQVRSEPVPQDNRYTAQYNVSNTPRASRTFNSQPTTTQTTAQPSTQPTAQSSVQRTSQQVPRVGSQYFPPAQTRPTGQTTQRIASPATSQGSTARASQYASQAQSKPASQALSSASPKTTAQQIARHNSQYASPNGSGQSTPHTVAPSATQVTAQQYPQNIPRPHSQFNSPISTAESLPQTTAPTDTQIRPPQISQYFSRPYPSPQSRTQSLPQEDQKPAAKPAQAAQPSKPSKATPKAGPKPKSQPAPVSKSQPTSKPSPAIPAARQPTQSATPPIQNKAPQAIPPQRPPSTQTIPPASASAPRRQPSSQTPQAPPPQPAPGPQGPQENFTTYAYQPPNPTDRTYLKRRHDVVSRFNEADAAKKLAYDPKTIARDILIAASRHPTEPTLNHHLFRLRDVFTAVDMNSDLATFRWDLVDPGTPSRDAQVQARAPPPAPMQTSQTAPPPAVQVPVNNISAPQPPVHQQHRPPQPLQQVQLPPPPPQQPKPQTQPQIQVQAQPQPTRSPVSRPPPGAHTPSTPNTMEKKRRGRPPGSTNKPKVAIAAPLEPLAPPTASYPVYACKWGICQAELHNLEGLKKHIFKVHVSKQITCGWRGCAFTGTLPAADLMKHVKEEHLDALAWKLGDGPTVPKSVDRNSSANTVPVTIPGSNQLGNEDSLIFPADYRSIRAFNKVHGKNSQQEKAREIFKAVQRLKEHIGVGLDPGGCELATPLRNQRVSDEEDVYELEPIS